MTTSCNKQMDNKDTLDAPQSGVGSRGETGGRSFPCGWHAKVLTAMIVALLLSGPAISGWAQDEAGLPPAAGPDEGPPPDEDAARPGPADDAGPGEARGPAPEERREMRRRDRGPRFEEHRRDRKERRRGGWGRRGDERGGEEYGGRHGRHEGHLGRMGRFLGFMKGYIETVQDSTQATGLAALGIKDHYKRLGRPADAIPFFEEQLAKTKDQKTRNVLLFSIRQVYEETKNDEKLLELNKQILRENAR